MPARSKLGVSNCAHYRIVFKEVGVAMLYLSSLRDVCQVLSDAVKGCVLHPLHYFLLTFSWGAVRAEPPVQSELETPFQRCRADRYPWTKRSGCRDTNAKQEKCNLPATVFESPTHSNLRMSQAFTVEKGDNGIVYHLLDSVWLRGVVWLQPASQYPFIAVAGLFTSTNPRSNSIDWLDVRRFLGDALLKSLSWTPK